MGIGDHIDSESRVPSQLAVGEFATASWVIHKGDARGFARLHLHVPAHLEVTPIQTEGASFDFDGEYVKLIWLDAPATSSFQVKLGIEAKNSFSGGTFEPLWSYIVDGRRQDVALDASYLGTPENGIAGTPLLPTPTEWEIDGASSSAFPASTELYDPAGFSVTRKVFAEGPEVARVEFHITGHPKRRMLRLVDQLPDGCRAEHDVLERATVKFESQEITFYWFNAPSSNSFYVSYRIMGDLTSCLPQLAGAAEFAVGESTQMATIPGLELNEIQDPSGWLNLNLTAARPDNNPVNVSDVAMEVPAPDPGISYRVQIMAAHRYVDGPWFKRKFEFASTVDAEPHEDWIKYTTGAFSTYSSARNRREELNATYSFPGPFVTAYEHGQRITVQEALVLANQQWLP